MSLGGGGGTERVTSTQTSVQELSPEQQQLLSLVIPQAEQFVANPPTLFPESQISPFNPLQLQAQQQALQAGAGPISQQINQGLTAQSGILGSLLPSSIAQQNLLFGGSLFPTLQGQQALLGPSLQNALSGQAGLLGQGLGTSLGVQGALGGQGLDPSLAAQQAFLSPENLQNLLGAQNFLLGPALFPETNPALAQAIQGAVRPLTEQFTQSVLPGIRSEAITAGQLGGNRQGIAEGLASQAFLRQVGDVSSQLQNQAFQTGLGALSQTLGQGLGTQQAALQAGFGGAQAALTGGFGGATGALGPSLGAAQGAVGTGFEGLTDLIQRALQTGGAALGNLPALAGLPLLPSQITEAVGTQQRQLSQAQLSEEAQRFLAEQVLPFTAAQEVAALAFGIPGGTATTQGTATGPGTSTSPLQSVLGIGGLLAALIPLLSDRRLKRNIVKIGRFKELNVYVFNYLWSAVRHIGVMADEVLKVKPEAVVTLPSGYLAVYYAKL